MLFEQFENNLPSLFTCCRDYDAVKGVNFQKKGVNININPVLSFFSPLVLTMVTESCL